VRCPSDRGVARANLGLGWNAETGAGLVERKLDVIPEIPVIGKVLQHGRAPLDGEKETLRDPPTVPVSAPTPMGVTSTPALKMLRTKRAVKSPWSGRFSR